MPEIDSPSTPLAGAGVRHAAPRDLRRTRSSDPIKRPSANTKRPPAPKPVVAPAPPAPAREPSSPRRDSRLIWAAGGGAAATGICGLVFVAWLFAVRGPPPVAPLAPPPAGPAAAQAATPAPASAPTPTPATFTAESPHDAERPVGAGPAIDFVAIQTASQLNLEALTPERNGLLYRDVRTVLSGPEASPDVNFCGEVNSLNPAGAYEGFQRFISSPVEARLEAFMTPGAFNQVWAARCSGRLGPKLWS